MKLTIARVRNFTERALRDRNLGAEIESIEWIGQRSKEKFGPLHFRVARVVLKLNDRRVAKTATLDSSNGFRIA